MSIYPLRHYPPLQSLHIQQWETTCRKIRVVDQGDNQCIFACFVFGFLFGIFSTSHLTHVPPVVYPLPPVSEYALIFGI